MMEINYKYEMSTENGRMIRKAECWGSEIDIEKFNKINKICFDYGYEIDDIIRFLIENIKEDDVEQILATMDGTR